MPIKDQTLSIAEKLLRSKKLDNATVQEFFFVSYAHYKEINLKIETLDLSTAVSRDAMRDYFKDQLWTLQVAHANMQKTSHLRHDKNTPADGLLTKIDAYRKAVEYLEYS